MQRIPSLLLLVALSGCAPLKGYEGPTLPRHQVSTVVLGSSPEETTVEALVDHHPLTAKGIYLHPGRHQFTFKLSFQGEAEYCENDDPSAKEKCFTPWRVYSCLGWANLDAGAAYFADAQIEGDQAKVLLDQKAASVEKASRTLAEWPCHFINYLRPPSRK